jgi:putative copper resistance protein D
MEVIFWSLLIVIGKLAIYIGFASAIAGIFQLIFQFASFNINDFNRTHRTTLKSMSITCLFAIFGTIFWFVAQTGAMAEEGIQGVLDPMMLEIMWDSSIGTTTQFRLLSFLILTTVSANLLRLTTYNNMVVIYISLIALIISGLFLIYSFLLSGHSVELGLIPQFLIAVHIVIFGWWFGSLYPLLKKCSEYNYNQLHEEMDRFGRQATIAVPLLLVAGGMLAYQLIGSISEFFGSSYGRALMLKLLLVVCILALAAHHKFKLVPLLKQHEGKETLARSITIEMGIAVTILLITSGLTSFVGPE